MPRVTPSYKAAGLVVLFAVSAAVPLACGSSDENAKDDSSAAAPTVYVPGDAPSQNPLPPGAAPRDASIVDTGSPRDTGATEDTGSSGGGDSGGASDAGPG